MADVFLTMLSNQSVTIFDIPLILELISESLSKKDLQQCILVSHAWHDAFIPFLWHDIRIFLKCSLKRFRAEEVHSVLLSQNRASLIHSITTYRGELFPWLQPNPQRNKRERKRLRRLQHQQVQRQKSSLDAIVDVHNNNIIKMNNEIEDQCKVKGGEDAQGNIHSTAFSRLHLSPSKFAPPLPAQVSSFEPLVLTNLKVLRCLSFPCDLLSTGHNNEYLYQILTFVEACPHLHTFELDHFVYESHFIIRLSKVLCHHSSLKDFSLLPAKAIHLRDLQILLRHCNRLESLEVACYPYCPTTSSEEEMKELEEMPETTIRHLNFARVVSSGLIPTLVAFLKKCPQLIELRFLDHNESQLLMETITNYLPKLCRLDFSRTTIQIARVINACQTGIESFKDICLASCSAVQGRDIQAILVSCPNLVSFHVRIPTVIGRA
ncbi:hypothetical protein BCR41DRAFT_383797, partial [Lobosporangium transversale]